jgi:DNA-binding XRE family transcriptional regulator
MHTGKEHEFDVKAVQRIRRAYCLKSRFERLREKGLLTKQELAEMLNVKTRTIKEWKNGGLILGYHYNDKFECLYEPTVDYPEKWKRKYSVKVPQPTTCVESLEGGAV